MFFVQALTLSVILALFVSAFTAYFTSLISKSPNALFDYVKDKVLTVLTFNSNDTSFYMVRMWLQEKTKNTRNLKVSETHGEQTLTIGNGTHRFWYYGPMWLTYHTQKSQSSWEPPQETYTISFFGTDKSKVQTFLKELQKFRRVESKGQTEIYTWRRGSWGCPSLRRPRSLDTVYMAAAQKAQVLSLLTKFISSEQWYHDRGIPWRIGCLFEGPPGSGKTTLAQALAAHFKRPIYSVNLKGIPTDEALIEALSDVRRDGVVLIEDVDAFNIATKRENIATEATKEEEDEEEDGEGTHGSALKAVAANKGGGITISGLLNAIDGVTATEGRILIMTTNDVTQLDPALIRNGRVDIRMEIGPLGPTDVINMFKVFFPEKDSSVLTKVRTFAEKRCHTASWWQNLFIQHDKDIESILV